MAKVVKERVEEGLVPTVAGFFVQGFAREPVEQFNEFRGGFFEVVFNLLAGERAGELPMEILSAGGVEGLLFEASGREAQVQVQPVEGVICLVPEWLFFDGGVPERIGATVNGEAEHFDRGFILAAQGGEDGE